MNHPDAKKRVHDARKKRSSTLLDSFKRNDLGICEIKAEDEDPVDLLSHPFARKLRWLNFEILEDYKAHKSRELSPTDEFLKGLYHVIQTGKFSISLVVACQTYMDLCDIVALRTSEGLEGINSMIEHRRTSEDKYFSNKSWRHEKDVYSRVEGEVRKWRIPADIPYSIDPVPGAVSNSAGVFVPRDRFNPAYNYGVDQLALMPITAGERLYSAKRSIH